MISRRTTRRTLLGGAAAVLLSRRADAGQVYQPLFRVERNKNANIVQYDAVLENREKLVPKQPVASYWVMLAEDGRREGLTSLDKRAYGFKVLPEPSGSWLLYLNATKDRSIRVVHWQGRWVAQILIKGRSAVLGRIYVFADESAFIPRVRWIDLFGVDMVTGAAVSERLEP